MPDTEVLFGGRVRADALEALASTSRPLTGYRVAKIVGAQAIQVQTILNGLSPHFVRRTPAGWLMVDDLLRRFVRDQVSRREETLRLEKDQLLTQLGLRSRHKRGRR